MANEHQEQILREVAQERDKQDRKWGVQEHSDLYWLGILVEEVGEVAKELIEKNRTGYVRSELTQVAAVAVAWMECRRRRAIEETF